MKRLIGNKDSRLDKYLLPDKIPKGYALGPDGWNVPKERVGEELPDGTRKLITLDISINPAKFVKKVNEGSVEPNQLEKKLKKFYTIACSNPCPDCFDQGEMKNTLISWENLKKHALEPALQLGLESVKFLGPGEFLANPDMFNILDYFKNNNIKFLLFTQGNMLQDDKLALKYHGLTSNELVDKLCAYDILRFMVHNHSTEAIARLIEKGMNADTATQRLSIQTNPVTPKNIQGVFDLFKWGIDRNIPVYNVPTMICGKGLKLIKETIKPEFQKKLEKVWTDSYIYVIERGIMTLKQINEEGVHPYAGMRPCNQLTNGLFIRKDGVVFSCPGNDEAKYQMAEDIRKKPLREIWINSDNYSLKPQYNNQCVKDGVSISIDLYGRVLNNIRKTFSKESIPA